MDKKKRKDNKEAKLVRNPEKSVRWFSMRWKESDGLRDERGLLLGRRERKSVSEEVRERDC